MVRALDDMDEFERFREEVLPELRKLMYAGANAEEMAEFAESRLMARAVTIGLTHPDAQKALAAIKEVLDRGKGKAVERREVSVNTMSDGELNALIKAELEASGKQ